jgi:hypothetical protein
MREYLGHHPDISLEQGEITLLAEALDDAWQNPTVALILFDDKLSLRQTLAKWMIVQFKLGNADRAKLCQEGVAYLTSLYPARWRN